MSSLYKHTKKAGVYLLLLIILAFNLTACGLSKSESNNKKIENVSLSELHFDTIMTISLYGTNKDKITDIINDSYKEIDRLEGIYSSQLNTSELAKINQRIAKGETEFVISDELKEVINYSLEVNKESNGAFDITIGNLINLWGIGTDYEKLPTQEEIDKALEGTGEDKISLDYDKNILRVSSPSVALDLGAVAKGYAADLIKDYILSKDSSLVGILDFGGNIMTIGSKTDGSNWKVGVTNPKDPSSVYGGLSLTDKCVVTSGNYERFFEKDGVRYHHILDASTGYPADKGLVSATIIGSSSLQCDALSTAAFCLGKDKALELINSLDGVECILIDGNGNYYESNGLSDYNFTKAN